MFITKICGQTVTGCRMITIKTQQHSIQCYHRDPDPQINHIGA